MHHELVARQIEVLQRFLLRVLSSASASSPDGAERNRQHVTATLGCCSTIRIEEHEEQENTHAPIKDDDTSSECQNDSSDLS